MKIFAKDEDRKGIYRTLGGGIHLQTEIKDGTGTIESKRTVSNPVAFHDHDIDVITGYDQLVINFSNNKHLNITTRNTGDPIGEVAWRHMARVISEFLVGKDCIKDGFICKDERHFFDDIANNAIEQIEKIVRFENNFAKT